MSRYIDADKLKTIESIQSADFNSIESIRRWIDEQQTADVVEVVRCKDCKYSSIADFNDYEDEYRCELLRGHLFFSGDYCSYGKRKDNE